MRGVKARKIPGDIVTLSWLILLFFLLYSFISLQKHHHFQTFAWDTSVFIQELHYLANFKEPYSSLVKMNGLGDHFQVFFLTIGIIFYKFFSRGEVIFVLQSFIATISAVPLYFLTKHNLSQTHIAEIGKRILSLTLCFIYLFSVSFQAMMADEFHNEPLVALPLLSMLYFLTRKNFLGFWISFIFVMLTKEIFSLLAIPLSVYIFFAQRKFTNALLVLLIGAAYFYMIVFQVMPKIAGTDEYLHFAEGNRPSDIFSKFRGQPEFLVTEFFNHPKKVETIISGMFSFGFLPLLSPVNLIMPTAALAIRFYDDTTPRLYEFNNHYASPFIPLMAVAASFGVVRLLSVQSIKKNWGIVFLFLISCSLFQDFYFHGPLNSIFKKSFYEVYIWEKDTNELIQKVPEDAIIASQNSLLPHLSQRDNFYLLPEVGDAEYIPVDLEEGPNKFAPLNSALELKKIIDGLILAGRYQIIWQQNKAILLEKSR